MSVELLNETGLNAPAHRAAAVTPSDTVDLAPSSRGVYVGGAGNLVVIMAAESDDTATVTFTGVAAGTVLPIRVRRIKATSTTATSIVSLY